MTIEKIYKGNKTYYAIIYNEQIISLHDTRKEALLAKKYY